GCSASAISKLESGTDAELRWSEIGNYSKAIGIQSALVLDDPSMPAASRIKNRVIEIGELLDEIVELAHIMDDDPEIIESIHDFYKELSYNFYLRYERTKGRLPKINSWDQTEPLVDRDTSDCSDHEAPLLEHLGI
ncbi:MAG: hypothetical protein WBQ23_08800, partial [Bacteroidota bacterium]